MKRLIVLALMGAALLGATSDARAGVVIATSPDGVTWTAQTLTGTSNEVSADVLAASVVVGGVTFTGLHSASSTYPGTATSAILNSTSGSATGTGTAFVAYGISAFSAPTGAIQELTSISATGTSPGGGKATITSFATSPGSIVVGPGLPAMSNPVGPTSVTVANGASAGSPTASVGLSLGTPFTLFSIVQVDLDGGGGISFNGTEQVVVPEPSSMALLGCGIASMLGYGWKRRRVVA